MDLAITQILIGALIGILGCMFVDIKTYIDRYIKPVYDFNEIVEKAYLSLRFKNMNSSEIANYFNVDSPCIPNYLKYVIKKQDYEALEAIVVVSYLQNDDESRMIFFNANRFLLIGSLFLLTIMIIFAFLVLGIMLYASPINILSSISVTSPLIQSIYPYQILLMGIIPLILISFSDHLSRGLSNLNFYLSKKRLIKKDCEKSYQKKIDQYKIQYEKLRKDGYKLKINISKDDNII